MKNLFRGAILLTCFAIAISLVQISCSKTEAQTNSNNQAGLAQLNKILFTKNTVSGEPQIWTANYDGTNATLIPVALPTDIHIAGELYTHSVRLSPDGNTIFFSGYNATVATNFNAIYACNIDGTNVREIIPSDVGNSVQIRLGGAY